MKFDLNQPYPLNESIQWRLVNSCLFGVFVFLFLFLFQPFELSKLPQNIFLIALGYGIVCFTIMAVLNIGAFRLLPKYFSEDRWTTRKELFWIFLNVLVIGLGNYFFSAFIKIIGFTWWNLFLFEIYTLAVGVFPLTLSILFNQIRLKNKFESQSITLTKDIEQKQNKHIAGRNLSKIVFANGAEKLELGIEDFLFAKSKDNYVEIYYMNKGAVCKKLIRNTLKNIYSQLSGHETIFKCHKSYLVNLKYVQRVSGNAQGYKLHLKNADYLLPVSRTHNESIKLYFADNH